MQHNIRFANKYSFRSLSHWPVLTIVLASLLLFSGCHSSRPKADKGKPGIEVVKTGKLHGMEKKIVEEALSWMGTPYRYAGSEKGKGTDCSGMVTRVYEDVAGIKLPRSSKQQSEFCKKIKRHTVKPGDLVFFATGKDKSRVSHVGIMIDDNRFVHASTKKGVVVSEMTMPYYERTFIMYGRVPK